MTDGQQLEFTRATKRFGALTAVDDLSARIEPGAVTAFLGPNGAGKTTSLRMLLGQIRPSSGTVTIGGVPYAELRQPLRVVGAVLEEPAYRPRRTAQRLLTTAAKANGIPLSRVDEVLAMVGLQNDTETRIGTYSLGMRQRLSIASALLGDPGALVLDEPANGLDPEGIRWMRLLMRRLADEGRTVLVSSHVLSEIEQVADNVLVLSKGRLVYADSIGKLSDPSTGSVVVDAVDRDALATTLRAAGLRFDVLRNGLTVHSTDAAAVGATAAAAGIALTTLQQRGPRLEEVFLDLVHGRREPLTGTIPVVAAPAAEAAAAESPEAADAEALTEAGAGTGAAVAAAAVAGAAVAGAALTGASEAAAAGADDAGTDGPDAAPIEDTTGAEGTTADDEDAADEPADDANDSDGASTGTETAEAAVEEEPGAEAAEAPADEAPTGEAPADPAETAADEAQAEDDAPSQGSGASTPDETPADSDEDADTDTADAEAPEAAADGASEESAIAAGIALTAPIAAAAGGVDAPVRGFDDAEPQTAVFVPSSADEPTDGGPLPFATEALSTIPATRPAISFEELITGVPASAPADEVPTPEADEALTVALPQIPTEETAEQPLAEETAPEIPREDIVLPAAGAPLADVVDHGELTTETTEISGIEIFSALDSRTQEIQVVLGQTLDEDAADADEVTQGEVAADEDPRAAALSASLAAAARAYYDDAAPAYPSAEDAEAPETQDGSDRRDDDHSYDGHEHTGN